MSNSLAHPLDATRDEMREKERKRSSNPTDQRDDSPVKVCNCAKALIVVIVRGQKRGRTKGSQEREAPLPTRRSSVSSVASSSSPMRHRMRRHHGRSPDEMSTFPAVALDLRRPLFSSPHPHVPFTEGTCLCPEDHRRCASTTASRCPTVTFAFIRR